MDCSLNNWKVGEIYLVVKMRSYYKIFTVMCLKDMIDQHAYMCRRTLCRIIFVDFTHNNANTKVLL